MKTVIKGKWSAKPPRAPGYYFVRDKRRLKSIQLVEVRRKRITCYGPPHRPKSIPLAIWQWSFIDGLSWNPTDDYPCYQWIGPLIPPT